MKAIWVIFGQSVVIPKKEKWPADIGTRTWEPRFTCPNANHCNTGDEHPQLLAAIACVPPLPLPVFSPSIVHFSVIYNITVHHRYIPSFSISISEMYLFFWTILGSKHRQNFSDNQSYFSTPLFIFQGHATQMHSIYFGGYKRKEVRR